MSADLTEALDSGWPDIDTSEMPEGDRKALDEYLKDVDVESAKRENAATTSKADEGEKRHAVNFAKLSYAQYDARPGISQSQLQQMRRSPAHCRAYIDGHRRDSDEKDFGRHLHEALLEPEGFYERVKVIPFKDRRAKGYKEWSEALLPTDVELTKKEEKAIRGCIDSAHCHPTGAKIFDEIYAEVSLFAAHEETGLMRKGRIDIITRGRNFLGDCKFVVDASEREFSKAIFFYGWYLQAAYYLDLAQANGIDAQHFIFCAVEKEPPYACAFYQIQAEVVQRGRDEYERLLRQFKDCHASGKWPGYSGELQFIGLPAWAKERAA